MSFRVTGALSAAGPSTSDPSTAFQARGAFNLSVWGTFVATFVLERCLDGATWTPYTALGSSLSFTAPLSEVLSDPDGAAGYRLNVTSFTSGTINYGFGP